MVTIAQCHIKHKTDKKTSFYVFPNIIILKLDQLKNALLSSYMVVTEKVNSAIKNSVKKKFEGIEKLP